MSATNYLQLSVQRLKDGRLMLGTSAGPLDGGGNWVGTTLCLSTAEEANVLAMMLPYWRELDLEALPSLLHADKLSGQPSYEGLVSALREMGACDTPADALAVVNLLFRLASEIAAHRAANNLLNGDK